MNFFQHQQQAKKRTVLLVFLYILGVAGLVGCVACLLITAAVASDTPPDPGLIAGACGILLLIIFGASLLKSFQLSEGGGKSVAESLGGRQISPNSRDIAERRLYNVVEEMAIASGIPVPTIYIIDNEHSINAFAAGFSPNAAVIGVNRGTVELLTRDELQGVIAHEFSHILNGDMRMNLRLIGILFGLQLLATIGYFAFRIGLYLPQNSSRNNDKGAGAGIGSMIILGGLAVMVLGYIGVFFSAMIQAAISRQREFLADASAVQFTRNPDGIAGALKKIGCPNVGSQMLSPSAAEASHLFFGNACSMFSLGDLLATHPPLPLRIKRIDPSFDGKFPKEIVPVNLINEEQKTNRRPSALGQVFPPKTGVAAPILSSIASAASASLFPASIPESAAESAGNPLTAQSVFFALLLDGKEDIRRRQLAAITSDYLVKETLRLYPQIQQLEESAKIPLAMRVSSALRSMSKPQYLQFTAAVDNLIAADNKMDLFEYTLKAVLLRDLDIHFGLAKQLSVRYTALTNVRQECITVLSFLAYSGHNAVQEVQGAFSAAAQELGLTGSILPLHETTIVLFDNSLRKLAETAPSLKKKIYESFLTCVKYDGQITSKESELLRAVAAMLAIPMTGVNN
ncbi:MAG: M48 family metallopeptidase [Planctomycetaceae bacterium]|jgi:Zn-dependent protease with chaperone function|nr:M48 family metallopeptidase [Planctomycetaceae bacterium]